MEPKPVIVTGDVEIVKALVAENANSLLRRVRYRVRSYIDCKRTLARKLGEVAASGKIYRDLLSGDFAAKTGKAMAKMAELGVTDVQATIEGQYWGMDVRLEGKMAGKKATIYIRSRRWGPECDVYLARPDGGSDLALHIMFGSRNMIVRNTLLDIAVEDRR
jgi:AraC-like DNA-binding protein